jgi:lipooligosaccharide transport system permease protein
VTDGATTVPAASPTSARRSLPGGLGAAPGERRAFRPLYVVRRNFLVWRKLMFSSLVGNLVDPLIYLIGLGYGIGALGAAASRAARTSRFLAAGMICYSTMNSATFEALYGPHSPGSQIQRTWEGILHAPMTTDDVVLGEWLWAGLKALFSGTAILLVMYAFGVVRGIAPLAVLPVALLVGARVRRHGARHDDAGALLRHLHLLFRRCWSRR